MYFVLLMFLLLFALPMGCVMWLLSAPTLLYVSAFTGGFAVLFVAALLLPAVLRRLRARPPAPISPGIVASLTWPEGLTRGEMEQYCAAWLRERGWQVQLALQPDQDARDVYVVGDRDGIRVAVLCDERGEALNPPAIRALALGAMQVGATYRVLLTLAPGRLPPPAEAAARQAGVMLLQVAELDELDALAHAAVAVAA